MRNLIEAKTGKACTLLSVNACAMYKDVDGPEAATGRRLHGKEWVGK